MCLSLELNLRVFLKIVNCDCGSITIILLVFSLQEVRSVLSKHI